ncbi:MAG: terpene cyclase/mutase family protein [Planctomycetaceae bacterium]|jgi:geranylgeranyl transferase type-2 subunit beta|nr:terpene cyclase/mutase family protein [Planctomycetaceae bacterium]
MPDTPFLLQLAQRLNAGLEHLTVSRLQRHREFIFSQQMPDGGFRGREGDSDLYYSAFAVRCLGLTGGINNEEASSLIDYMSRHDWRTLNTIDLLNYVYTALAIQTFTGHDMFANESTNWPVNLARKLEETRMSDGGYAKSPSNTMGSTYHSFLTVLTYELLGIAVPQPNRLIQFFYDRQRDDGGFVEISPMKSSGTNPTAAAAIALRILGGIDDELREDVKLFLREVRSGDGGFEANTRIPIADGLSTFTGLLTLIDIGIDPETLIPRKQVIQFVTHPEEGLELPTGGFRGGVWDSQADTEYTFYSLGILGLMESLT